CNQLEPYCKQPRIHEILHIKCPIIRLIKCQMEHMDHRLSQAYDLCQRKKTLSYKLWKHRWMIASLIIVMFLMICLFLYGTVVGAGLCSAASWPQAYNSPCPKIFPFLPGINLAKGSARLPF
ncbi:hypothetical protein NQ318_004179, partial [Aromia moschata]